MGVRPKGRVRLLRVRLVGLSVFSLRRRHRREKTLAQALTGQGRSSSCKIWEVSTQSPLLWTFRPSSILLPSGFRSLVGRIPAHYTGMVLGQPAAARARGGKPPRTPPRTHSTVTNDHRGEVVVVMLRLPSPPLRSIPKSFALETWARKGSMEQSVHRPLIKFGLFG